MELLLAFVHAIFLSFGLILPLGAQNVFIFNQGSLHNPFAKALPSIITASICDTVLITTAILGLSVILMENETAKLIVLSVGFVFLLYMGYSVWRQSLSIDSKGRRALSWKKQVLFAMSVSLLNPHAIIDTTLVIGTSSLAYEGVARVIFAIVCVAVSWIWFFGIALAGHNLHKIDKTGSIVRNINKVAALIIWVIASYLAIDIVQALRV